MKQLVYPVGKVNLFTLLTTVLFNVWLKWRYKTNSNKLDGEDSFINVLCLVYVNRNHI